MNSFPSQKAKFPLHPREAGCAKSIRNIIALDKLDKSIGFDIVFLGDKMTLSLPKPQSRAHNSLCHVIGETMSARMRAVTTRVRAEVISDLPPVLEEAVGVGVGAAPCGPPSFFPFGWRGTPLWGPVDRSLVRTGDSPGRTHGQYVSVRSFSSSE